MIKQAWKDFDVIFMICLTWFKEQWINQYMDKCISDEMNSFGYNGSHSSWSKKSWWRHQMETFSALLAHCAGNSPGPVNSPHKSQWRGALMFSFIYAWINDWVNNREAGDLRRQRGHYDVIVMLSRGRNEAIVKVCALCGLLLTIYPFILIFR